MSRKDKSVEKLGVHQTVLMNETGMLSYPVKQSFQINFKLL